MPKKLSQEKKKRHNFKKDFLYLCSCCAVILILLVVSFNVDYFLKKPLVLATQNDLSDIIAEKESWLQIISKYPNYRDGYLELARLSLELSDSKEAREFLQKAREIDPNSMKVKEVQKSLGL